METFNNATSAASRAIWGDSANTTSQSNESGREPVSGETGNTTSGEPYDAGNVGDSTETDSRKPISGSTDIPGNTASTGPIRSEHETDKTGVTSHHQPSSGFSSDKPTSSNDTSGPGASPSVGADPSSGGQQIQDNQGADRPHEEPGSSNNPTSSNDTSGAGASQSVGADSSSGGQQNQDRQGADQPRKETGSSEHERIEEAKQEAEDAQNVDTSGPGPKPLSETGGPKGDSGPTGVDEEEDGPQKESTGEGTGEKWVKSSGMKSDGGDFDASAAGAGREADRLLEEKGVHRTTEPSKDGDNASDPIADKANKPSLGEKIKAKFHKSDKSDD